jgi:sugar lactone lactonase YvrE
MKIELILDAKAIIGESPLWVAEENMLYWADIKAPSLHRMRLDGTDAQDWALPADIGAFALDGKGRALVALRTGLFWLDLATSQLLTSH